MNYLTKPSIIRSYLGLALGVLAFVFSFPMAFGKTPLWISQLSPLFIVIYLLPLLLHSRQYPKHVFFKAWGFYFLGLMGILYWVTISMKNYGDLSGLLSFSGLVAICLVRGFFAALALWLWQTYANPKNQWLLGAALFTIQDWALHYIPFGGFAWVSAGYALTPDLYWIQIADLVGIDGLNLTVYLTTFLLFAHLQQAEKRCITPPLALAVMLATIHIYGAYQLRQHSHLPTASNGLRVGWVQGNINQSLKWNPREKKNILRKYRRQTKALLPQNPDLVIWPEASVPVSQYQDHTEIHEISTQNLQVPILFGAPSFKYQDRLKVFFNSAYLTEPDGKIAFRYDKIHLVPFGEFVPTFGFDLRKRFPVLAGSFEAGEHLEVASIHDHPFGISICYEILYPAMFAKLSRQGASFFVNLTNDAWFELSSGPFQHLRFAMIRAIETRKAIIRVANTGVSALYLPTGQIKHQSTLFTDDTRVVTVVPRHHLTPFTSFPYAAHIIVLAFLAWSIRRSTYMEKYQV